MILAAGFGSRLRPLTDRVPKALVEVGGVPMLERIAGQLIEAGADRLIINVHHHADQVERFVADRDQFGVEVRISREEPAPLETGGGLKAAEPLFRKDAPFFLHNVDIVTEVPLREMYSAHARARPLATLAVSGRESSRMLRFDEEGLQARVDRRSGGEEQARTPVGEPAERAFAGVHVISPEIFGLMHEEGAFSIMAPYLRLAGSGRRIQPFDIGDALWLEIGNPDRLARARSHFEERDT